MSPRSKSVNPSRASSAEAGIFHAISGYGLRAVPFLLFFTCFIAYSPCAEPAESLAAALGRAGELRLADDPYWHTLLHYKPSLFGGVESLVDDPQFFFAPDGKTNPAAELRATIEAFFSPVQEGKRHPTVKFPGRYGWLRKRLELDPASLPHDGDVEYQKFKREIKPGSASIVFPAGYMSSPASMFGHTFLLVEAAGGSRLLAHSVNYAAITTETFGPVFAFKGLFGMYKGYYSFLPYYQKLREYGDIEMRDIWEYELDLSEEELDRLLRHVVEMEEIYSDYYFVGENCSYNLLFLVEAARPETKITDAFGLTVEPIETLKIVEGLGLVKKRIYRPSLYARIGYLASLLPDDAGSAVRDVCLGRKDASGAAAADLSDEERIVMWDLAADYLKFLAIRGDLSETEYRKRFLAILSERKKLGKFDAFKNLPEPPPPHAAHASRKLALETGSDPRGPYSDLSFRLTAHEAMDSDEGYNPNSQIVFGRLTGRWRWDERKFTLRGADLIDLVSLPPSDRYVFGACYQLKTGFLMNETGDETELLSYRLKVATGLSTILLTHGQVYAFFGLDSYFSPDYENGTDLLFGGETGLYAFAGRWKSHVYASMYRAPFTPVHTRWAVGVEERIEIARYFSLSGRYTRNGDYGEAWNEFGIRMNLYF